MPNLTKLARPAFAVWEGNGNLEGDFSRFERIRLEARGCNSELTRAIAKICVDGMRPDLLSKAQLGTALGPQSFVLRVQEKYVALYGERDYAAGEKKRKELAVPFVPKSKGAKRPKQEGGMALWRRDLAGQLLETPEGPSIFGPAPSCAAAASLARTEEALTTPAVTKVMQIWGNQRDRYATKLQADRGIEIPREVRDCTAREKILVQLQQRVPVTSAEIEAARGNFIEPGKV